MSDREAAMLVCGAVYWIVMLRYAIHCVCLCGERPGCHLCFLLADKLRYEKERMRTYKQRGSSRHL